MRHKRNAEWGVGRIVSVAGGALSVRFEGAPDPKRFRLSDAADHLEVLKGDDVPEHLRPSAPPAPEVAIKCTACSELLKRSRYSADGKWKACPKCSQRHGQQHVYRRCPEDFGVTPARAAAGSAEGIQSQCAACRRGHEAAFEGEHVRLCADLESTARR